jgi:hypothetical protein
MTRSDFMAAYSPDTVCMATYTNEHGHTASGLLVDGIQQSALGVWFVYINNFATRVQLRLVTSVVDTGQPWTGYGRV